MTKLRRKPSPDLTAYQWQGDETTIPQWVKDEKVACENNKLYVPNPQFAKKVGVPQSVAQDFTQADSDQDPALAVVRDTLNKDKKPPHKGNPKR
jgi:hypothetical protein